MIDELKPYPAYKNSGVEWLGEVPAHWEVTPIARLGTLVKGTGGNKEDEVPVGVPCVRYGDLYTQHEFHITSAKACVPEDRASTYTEIRHGNLLFAASGETIEDIGRSAVNVMDGPACCGGDVLLLRPVVDINPRYLGYAADAPSARNQKATMARGFTVIHIYGSQLKRLALTLPPLPEQAAIVRFLDYVDRRIQRVIRARRRRIELLEEYKQALIHQAVTGRIDVRTGGPYAAYKDSGVEWLGEVPAHWHVVRVGHLIQLTTGFPFKSEGFSRRQEDVRLLRGVNVSPGSLRWEDVVRWPAKERTAFAGFELEVGDIVLGMDRPIISAGIRVASVTAEDLPCLLLQRVARIRPLKGVDARFLLLVFAGQGFKDYLTPIFTGVSVPHLSPEQIRSFRLALPPFEDQVAVIKYIDAATTRSNAVVTNTRRSIALLEELRTRLIADVVTGKLDVREVVKRLPEEDGELEYPDGPDSSSARRPGQEDDLLETAGIGPEAVP